MNYLKKKKRFPSKEISRERKRISKKRLKKLWEIIILSSISSFLLYSFIKQTSTSISIDDIHIYGAKEVKKTHINTASKNFFPKSLLEINPKELEYILLRKLPLKSISITRKIFPPSIYIDLKEREPIAFASRINSNKIEEGMIDIDGYWIPLDLAKESKKKTNYIVYRRVE